MALCIAAALGAARATRGKRQWQYGRFELRARIPTTPGLWPAFWTLGVARPWPSSGEIDIMEYYRGKLLASFSDPAWAARFHTWRMDWDAQAIHLYVDD